MQEPQPLCIHLSIEKIDSRQVAARPSKAGDQTELDRVFADAEDDWDRRGCSFSRLRSKVASGCGNNSHVTTNEVGHKRWQLIELALQPMIFHRHVLALDVADFVEALTEGIAVGSNG